MLFNSLQFAVFFPTVVALYFLTPHRLRWLLLLIASCVFYMAFIPKYILILFFTIVVDYFAGIIIENAQGAKRKTWLVLSIISNCGVLAIFKYYNFLNGNFRAAAHFLDWNYSIPTLSIILPIGLSFHTFQAMSYTIEVYRGHQKAERHFGIYALYVMFFPQLVAGPIERPQNLLHQFYEKHYFDYVRVTDGLRLMLWGFFKKLVIADNAAVVVSQVFNDPTAYHGGALLLATLLFTYQIYCDFSGYSDIARGTARVLGFELMINFQRPYAARTIPDFWRRWHISLSTWFRDYVYIPMGGSRVKPWRRNLNLLIVFLISGLWHGANWTFVAWGAIHGTLVVLSNVTMKLRDRIFAALPRFIAAVRPALSVAITFILASFAWIFFRANTLSDALYICQDIVSGLPYAIDDITEFVTKSKLTSAEMSLFVASILFLEIGQWLHARRPPVADVTRWPAVLRWTGYYVTTLWILFFGFFGAKQFIYFQF